MDPEPPEAEAGAEPEPEPAPPPPPPEPVPAAPELAVPEADGAAEPPLAPAAAPDAPAGSDTVYLFVNDTPIQHTHVAKLLRGTLSGSPQYLSHASTATPTRLTSVAFMNRMAVRQR